MAKTKCGTIPYQAPEVLEKRLYSYEVDIWSLGVVLFKMVFHEYPFGDHSDVK